MLSEVLHISLPAVIFSYVHSNSKASIILLLCGIILIVVAMFWVAVGFQVGLQDGELYYLKSFNRIDFFFLLI